MLGFRELLIILIFFLFLFLAAHALVGCVWLLRSRKSPSPDSRLAKLEQLRSPGALTQAE